MKESIWKMGSRGRAPCCDKTKVRTGPWSPTEDFMLINFIQKHGHGNWRALPKQAGLLRCGKSCRLRWINYLRPDLKRGNFTPQEENTIIQLHNSIGNKWSKIASCLPGRTDNEIKNVWNTHLKKRVASNKIETPAAKTDCSQLQQNRVNEKPDFTKVTSSSQLKENVFSDDARPDFDVDFWEMLECLDPLQYNKTTDCEVEFGRFMENDLRLIDQQMIVKPNPQISTAFDCSLTCPPSPLGI